MKENPRAIQPWIFAKREISPAWVQISTFLETHGENKLPEEFPAPRRWVGMRRRKKGVAMQKNILGLYVATETAALESAAQATERSADAQAARGAEIAQAAGVSVLEECPGKDDGVFLFLDESGLSLRGEGMSVQGDFAGLARRIRPGNLQGEMLVKAARQKGKAPGRLVDATAGMGEDSFLLAAAGFSVDLFERDPIIGVLLEDALRRGAEDPELAPIVERMKLHVGDSVAALQEMEEPVDVVLLDPMFPKRQKSGLVKKKFQLIHHLEEPCEEEAALLAAARAANPGKIVIKRPKKGPYLAGVKPSYSLEGKAIRYDCVVLPR